jgi:hypothetical protein
VDSPRGDLPRQEPAHAAGLVLAASNAPRGRSTCSSLGHRAPNGTLFNIPGVGRLLLTAIQRSDLTVIQGVVLFGAFFIVTFNLPD